MQGCQIELGLACHEIRHSGVCGGESENGELWVLIYTDRIRVQNYNCYSPLVCVAGHYRDSDCDDVVCDLCVYWSPATLAAAICP